MYDEKSDVSKLIARKTHNSVRKTRSRAFALLESLSIVRENDFLKTKNTKPEQNSECFFLRLRVSSLIYGYQIR